MLRESFPLTWLDEKPTDCFPLVPSSARCRALAAGDEQGVLDASAGGRGATEPNVLDIRDRGLYVLIFSESGAQSL